MFQQYKPKGPQSIASGALPVFLAVGYIILTFLVIPVGTFAAHMGGDSDAIPSIWAWGICTLIAAIAILWPRGSLRKADAEGGKNSETLEVWIYVLMVAPILLPFLIGALNSISL